MGVRPQASHPATSGVEPPPGNRAAGAREATLPGPGRAAHDIHPAKRRERGGTQRVVEAGGTRGGPPDGRSSHHGAWGG